MNPMICILLMSHYPRRVKPIPKTIRMTAMAIHLRFLCQATVTSRFSNLMSVGCNALFNSKS